MTRARAVALAATLWLCAPLTSRAQGAPVDQPELRAHRVSVSGGLVWQSAVGVGSSTAVLRGNAPGAAPPPYTLFAADGALTGVAGAEARIGFSLTRRWSIEAAGAYARPRLAIDISSDPETAAVALAGERIYEFRIEGSVLWQLPLRLGPRARAYAIGGGGYLRQLHEERMLVERGGLVHAGAGVRYWLRGAGGARRAAGVRAEIRAMARRGGVEFTDDTRVHALAHVMAFVVL